MLLIGWNQHGEEAANFPDRGNTTCEGGHGGLSKVNTNHRRKLSVAGAWENYGRGLGGGPATPCGKDCSLQAGAGWDMGRACRSEA